MFSAKAAKNVPLVQSYNVNRVENIANDKKHGSIPEKYLQNNSNICVSEKKKFK